MDWLMVNHLEKQKDLMMGHHWDLHWVSWRGYCLVLQREKHLGSHWVSWRVHCLALSLEMPMGYHWGWNWVLQKEKH